MQIPTLPRSHFDISGDLSDNYINGEIFSRLGKSRIEVFVPREAPFFVESLVIKTPEGRKLEENVDYQIVKIDGEYTAFTGKLAASIIRLLDDSLDELFLYYQSLGSVSPIGNSIKGMLDFLINDTRPVKLSNITGVPNYFVPDVHYASLRYDYYNFDTLTSLVVKGKEILEAYNGVREASAEYRKPYIANHALELKAQVDLMVNNHIETNNPHNLTKDTFNKGLVANVPTATIKQALQGKPNMRLTAKGLHEIVKYYSSKANGLMPTNILPIFHYGTDSYLPPAIDGSYIGLGSNYPTGCGCVEINGDLVVLQNRYNGVKRGLYYSLVDNFANGNREGRFTDTKFSHASLEADNPTLDTIANGSNGKLMLVADSTDLTKSYLVTSNGTLDSRNQIVTKIDTTAIASYNPLLGSIYEVGNYYLYVQLVKGELTEDNIGAVTFYTSIKGDLTKAGLMQFTPLTVNATDWCGNVTTDKVVKFGKLTADADGISEYILTFTNKVKEITTAKTVALQAIKKPKAGNVAILHFHYSFNANTGTKLTPWFNLQLIYELDIDNATLLPKNELMVKDRLVYDSNDENNPNHYLALQNKLKYDPSCLINSLGNTSAILDNYRVVSFSNSDIGSKVTLFNFNPGVSDYDMVSKPWGFGNLLYLQEQVNINTNTPFNLIGECGFAAFADKFDIVYGLGVNLKQQPFVKCYHGEDVEFKVRDGISCLNKAITTIYSRPLTNDLTQLLPDGNLPIINLTASRKLLDKLGIKVGELSFSCATNCKGLNYPSKDLTFIELGITVPILTDFAVGDGGISLIRANQLDIDAWIVDEIIFNGTGLKRGEINYYGFDIYHLTGLRLAKEFNLPSVVVINYATHNEPNKLQNVTILVNFKLATNGLNVGGIELIAQTTPTVVLNNVLKHGFNSNKRLPLAMVGYLEEIEGGLIFSYEVNSSSYYQVGNEHLTVVTKGKFNFKTSLITENSAVGKDKNFLFGVIPDKGIVETVIPYKEQAGGSALYLGDGDSSYLVNSTYVAKQFTIFFTGNVQVMLAGNKYMLKSGSIDLRDLITDPTNKEFYVYARLANGLPEYHITLKQLTQTPYCGLVAKVTTDANGIKEITKYHKFTVDGVDVEAL